MVAIPLLMACDRTQTPGRAEVNFDTDSSVLRGTWNGGSTRVGEDQTLSLEVTATYIDDSSYSISGKGLLNNDEVTVSGVGKLSPRYKYVKSQVSPAPFANAVFKLVGKVTGESAAYCGGYSSLGELAYFCTVEPGSAYLKITRKK